MERLNQILSVCWAIFCIGGGSWLLVEAMKDPAMHSIYPILMIAPIVVLIAGRWAVGHIMGMLQE